MRFEGKSAVVTGGSEGIGFAIAAGLVEAGARVLLVARREAPLAEAAEKLGPAASYVAGDVADAAVAERAVAEAVARHGGLDLLVNNAAVLLPGRVGAQPLEEIDHMLGVNLRGTILFTRAAVEPLSARPGAAILNIGSPVARRPSTGVGIYGATKVAVSYLTTVWAMELAPAKIRVNCLNPGSTDTPAIHAVERAFPGNIDRVLATNLVKRLVPAEEVAQIALMLLDDQRCGFVTGATWDADCGYRLG